MEISKIQSGSWRKFENAIKEEKISKEVNLQSSNAEEDDPKIKDDVNHKKSGPAAKKLIVENNLDSEVTCA